MNNIAMLAQIDTSLRDKLIARLAMRWPSVAAHTPMDSTQVLFARSLPEQEQAQLDNYVLGYQDAIIDILDMLDKSGTRPEPPYALRQAENSIFQGGSLPPKPKAHSAHKEQRGTDRMKGREALKGLKGLFSGGGK